MERKKELQMKTLIKIKAISLITGFIVFLAIFFSACQNSSTKENNVLKLNISTEPPTLDPRLSWDLVSFNVLRTLYDGLVRDSNDGTGVVPAMAESYEISDDKKTYTFHLRDAVWSNGDPVVAEDFVYAWKWILSPKTPSPSVYKLYYILNAENVKTGKADPSTLGLHAPDSKTLVVTLEKPTPYFLELLVLACYYPVNHRIAEQNPQWAENFQTFVSNGPFKLSTWQPHDKIVVTKNPTYWDADAVKLSRIEMVMVNNSDTELNMFENGDLDWAGRPLTVGLPTDSLESLREKGLLKTSPWAATTYYTFNTKKYPFNNKKIRQAFAYAINREEIVKHVLQGQEEVSLSLLPTSLKVQDTPYFQDNDIETAKKLFKEGLAELNIRRKQFPKITLIFNTSDIQLKLAQAIQEQWRKVLGVNIDLKHYEWKVYLDEVSKKEFTIARFGLQSAYNDPMTILEVYTDPNNSMNRSSWYNKYYNQLIENSFYQLPEDRKITLNEAEQIIMDEMPVIPLFFSTMSRLENPRLKGVAISPVGLIDFTRSYFENSDLKNESES